MDKSAHSLKDDYTHFEDEYRAVYEEVTAGDLQASVERGLAQSAAGEVTDLGDFTQYAAS